MSFCCLPACPLACSGQLCLTCGTVSEQNQKQVQVAAAAASVGGGFAAVKGSLGSWGTYLKGQADKVGETVAARAGSSPLAAGRSTSARSPGPVNTSSQRLP